MSEQIVVGVDGSAAAEKALIWAAETESRRGAQLVIAHGDAAVPGDEDPSTTLYYHHQFLREAVATAIEVSGTRDIRTVLRSDPASRLLLELSETADMLVVGSRGAGALATTLLGSVANRVAAHARCAVVVVPGNWRVPSAEDARPVAVGVSASASGRDALEFAFVEAEGRGVPLIAVRCWVEWAMPLASFKAAGHNSVRHREQEQLAALVDEAWSRHPSVEVDTELSSASVYNALLSAAERCELLVTGCYNDDHPFSRLGFAGSRLLHTSPCPVVIVGQPRAQSGESKRAALAGQSIEHP